MESHQPYEQQTGIKRSHSLLEDQCENELSTANSLFSVERLHIKSALLNSKPSDLSVPVNPPMAKAEPVTSTASSQIKCLYCDESCLKEQIRAHEENCEKRKIHCEACGEMVMLDIFDFHLETCANRPEANEFYQDEQYGYLYPVNDDNVLEGGLPQESWNDEENYDDPEGDPEGEPDSLSYEDEYDPNALTYEELITLDHTIVKKGMTEKEMEQFPINVHQKDSDGCETCSVCITEVESGETIRKLTCGHKFHKDCVDTWLNQNITCPVCKKFLR